MTNYRKTAILKMIARSFLALVPAFASANIPGACSAVTGNLVSNCGFETGDFTNWTLSGNFGYTTVETNNNYAANSGNYYAQVGPLGSDGFLSQTFATNPGSTYSIQWLLNSDGYGPNDFNATWNGKTIFSQSIIPASGGWIGESVTSVASGTTSTLKFGFMDDPSYIGLDDISVTPAAVTPEPGFFGVLMVGFAGLLAVKHLFRPRTQLAASPGNS